MTTPIYVFVYGTLKRDQPNHHWLKEAKFVSTAETLTKFPLIIGTRYNIPILLDKKGSGYNILGEIYAVSNKTFAELDQLEDFPKFYDREIVEAVAGDEKYACWIYLQRRFPENVLNWRFFNEYTNCEERPYCPKYLDGNMYENIQKDMKKDES